MQNRILFTCLAFFSLLTFAQAQYQEFYYNERMEGQTPFPPFLGQPVGLEDPSFEFPFSARPRQDKIFVSKDFETNDFSSVQSLTRSWIGTADEERVLGRKFLRINGTGGLANWFPIRPLFYTQPSLGHYVTVRARQDGPNEAIFGINYFDSNWKLIQKDSALISGADVGVSRGDGDLLKKYTIPTRVPYNAAFGQVWIAAPFANGTTTFDFLNVFTEKRYTLNEWFSSDENLLRNSTPIVSDIENDFDFLKTGYEFWNAIPGSEAGVRLNAWSPEVPSVSTFEGSKAFLLGQRGRITNIYQVFDVDPNQSYSVTLFTRPRTGLLTNNPLPHARGWFGIDFFDANANKVVQLLYDLSDGNDVIGTGYTPPSNVDFAIAWFYVEPLFRNEVIPIFSVDVHVTFVDVVAAAAKTSTASAPAVTVAAKTTVAKSKSKKQPPASPITPAIALQAKNSLPATVAVPVVTKPTTKPTPKTTAVQKPAVK